MAMDLFFQPSHGNPFSIEVGYFNTVLGIKEKIQKYQLIPVSKQTLIFNGNTLPDDLVVCYSEILDGSRINLLISPDADPTTPPPPPPSTKIQLLLKVSSSKPGTPLEADIHDTIQRLKEKMQEMVKGLHASWIVVHANGIELQDSQTVKECGLSDNSEINVAIRLSSSSRQSSTKIQLLVKVSSFGPGKPLEADINDTIQRLKEKIQEMDGVHASLIVVHANGIELQDSQTVKECGLSDNSEIYVGARRKSSSSSRQSSTKIQLLVKVSSSKPGKPLKANIHDTIQRLKEKIQEMVKLEVHASHIVVYANGTELQDSKTIKECGLSDNSEIYVAARRQSSSRQSPTKMIRVFVLTYRGKEKVPVEVSPSDIVGELREKMEKMKLDLPKEYFFIHKQSVMEDDMSFEWHEVCQGDTIEIFPGRVSPPKPL